MSESSGARRYLIGGGAAACAVCCAPPVLALVGIAGAGTVATIATFALAGLVFAAVVAVASVLTFFLRKWRRDRVITLRARKGGLHRTGWPTRAVAARARAGRGGGECPRWDSNPQPVAFKATSSAGWDTGAQ